MTVQSETRVAGPFTGNDVITSLPFTFVVFDAADLKVLKRVTATGADTILTYGVDYTVSVNADQDTSPGGTVTLTSALATGNKAYVYSGIAALQEIVFTNTGGFYPEVLNEALDKLTALIQQVAEKQGRTLLAPIGETASLILPPAAQRTGLYLAFDASGNVSLAAGTNGSETMIQNIIGVPLTDGDLGTFLGTIIPDDTNIKTALQALENSISVLGQANRTALGLATTDSPEFAALNIGNASDTTLARVSAGNLSIEGNVIYRAGGTDVAVADGGTGSSTAASARANLGAAALGANTDITSLNAPALGAATATTQALGDVSTKVATTAFVDRFYDIPRTTSGLVRGMCWAISAGFTLVTGAPAGSTYSVYNDSAASITITQGAGMTLRLAGTTTTGSRALAPRTFATIWFNSPTEAIIMGNGVT